jgi:hypothetical protein
MGSSMGGPGGNRSPGTCRAFTLTELMVAVLVLIVVIIATSKIFGTASRVAKVGMATADVHQEATAIGSQAREDMLRLSHEGVFAIRCWAVRNDIRERVGFAAGDLLDPLLPAEAWIRADQMLFFTQGMGSQQTFTENESNRTRAMGAASRVYYGPAYQMPDAPPQTNAANPVAPWYAGAVPLTNSVSGAPAGQMFIPPIPARQWILARQAILLADDDTQAPNASGKLHYTDDGDQGENSTYSIWDASIRNSRKDMAATVLSNVRRCVTLQYNLIPPANWLPLPGTRPWSTGGGTTQRQVIANALFFPRAERQPPTTHRRDHALTIAAFGSGCSSVMIDWTYDRGVGEVRDGTGRYISFAGGFYDGFLPHSALEHPWFGMPDPANPALPDPVRGVRTLASVPPGSAWSDPGYRTIFWENIEGDTPVVEVSGGGIPPGTIYMYEAFFGYNQDRPFDNTGFPSRSAEYTPWPSAIRITLRLHDPDGTLEAGRDVQFVLELPRRVRP